MSIYLSKHTPELEESLHYFERVAPEAAPVSWCPACRCAPESRRAAVSQSDSESEGGDQPSAENSASSGSRSTSLNNPKKPDPKKVRLEEEGRQKKREREKKNARCSKLLFAAICRELSSGVDFFFFFFLCCERKEKSSKAQS